MAQKKTKKNIYETYTEWYFDELKEHGYIDWYRREPETLICAEKLTKQQVKRLKKAPDKEESVSLFPVIRYTYDYIVCWNIKARYIFYDLAESKVLQFGKPPYFGNVRWIGNEKLHVGYFDTKPPSAIASFGKTSSSVTFPIKQRMLYELNGVYINKFIPIPMSGVGAKVARYCNTFRPKRYIFTDADGSSRVRKTPKWVQIDLGQFVSMRLKLLKDMLVHDRKKKS